MESTAEPGDRPVVALRPMLVGRPRALTDEEVAHFDLVAKSTARRARLVVVPVLSPGANGMTVGRWILLRDGHQRRNPLVAHELVHVEQWRDRGGMRFLVAYLSAYVRDRRRGSAHRAAYLAIPAEVEARTRAEVWSARYWL